MNYTLSIRADIIHDEDGNHHTVYGLDATNEHGTVLSVPDMAFSTQDVYRFIRRCEEQSIPLARLHDAIVDFVEELYTVDEKNAAELIEI